MAHSPFVVNNPNGKIANLEPPKEVNEMRMGRRVEMLKLTENNFLAQKRGQGPVDHKAVYAKTLRMMKSRTPRPSGSTRSPPPSATPTARARSARAA